MTMNRLIPAILCALAATLHAQQVKTFEIKADEWAEGDPPKEVFVVDGTIKIAARDGNKAIVIDPAPVTDASAQLAESAAGNASITARILGTKRARSTPRFGVSVHGMSGYRLLITPAKKVLELVKGDETLSSTPFTWTSDVWLNLKLEAVKGEGDKWTITGKAWAPDVPEPAEPLLKHEDSGLKGQGKCAIWATPFSGEPVYFDDILITIEPPAP